MAAGRCQPMYVYNKKALIEQKRSPFCTLGRLSGSPACLLSDDHDRSSTAPINYPLYTHVLGLHLLGHISMILFYPTCSNLRAPFHHVQLAIYIYIYLAKSSVHHFNASHNTTYTVSLVHWIRRTCMSHNPFVLTIN